MPATTDPKTKPTAAAIQGADFSPRTLAMAMAASVIAVLGSIAFVDRPVADLAHANRAGLVATYATLTHIVDPIPPGAALILASAVVAVLLGVTFGPRWRMALRLATTPLLAIALKEQLIRGLAGRTWPETWINNNPSYIKDGVYGFFPFAGRSSCACAYHSFPSGHMIAITATATAVALAAPRLRWVAPLPVALVAIGLLGANYHWVSDIIAGTAIGAATAVAVHRLGREG